MKLTIATTTIAASLIFASQAFAGSHTRSTEEVLNAHLTSFGAGDVDAIMQDYGEDSVVIIPPAKL